jgi:6-phosphogluconolactonase
LYELLPGERYRHQIPWSRVHWFVGDERFVPATDPRNNMSSACRLFLNACAPAGNVHPIRTDAASPEESARCYEHELQAFYGADVLDPARPLFDLALMGVGSDGHTASLFPGDAAVDERERWVVGVPVASVEPLVARVTLTLPALGSCREMLFLISGAAKRPILTRLLANENLPANRARSAGETVWLVDRAALPEDFRG